MTDSILPFHQSIAVSDLTKARAFYIDLLGCAETRSIPNERIEFNFYGHHVVAHLCPEEAARVSTRLKVNGKLSGGPMRHFGIVMPLEQWQALDNKARAQHAEYAFEPQTLFKDKLEQKVMMLSDGCGNAVEFKGIAGDINRLFAPKS
jgi:extradiol dioxygenase family protein